MNIAEILCRQCATVGDRIAIAEPRRRITFAELNRAATAAAEDLAQAGVAEGMRVLVFSPMAIDLYVAVIALFRLGAAVVFVDPSAGRSNLSRCIAQIRPDAFVAVPRAHLLRLTSAAVRRIPIKISIGGGVPGARALNSRGPIIERAVVACDDATPAIVTFTSGTTGDPKAVVRSHGFLRAQHRALVQCLSLAAGETDLTTLPIFLLGNLASGTTSVIPDADLRAPGRIDPLPVLDQIRTARPNRTVASPALLERLAAAARRTGQRLESFEKVFTGGAPVFPRTLDALAEAAPNADIVAVYGSSEAEPIASIDRREIAAGDRQAMQRGAGLLAGRPVPSIRVRIGSLEEPRDEPGGIGEILVSGEHVVTGDAWHRTGDAGYFDEQGRLWLLGRCSAKVDDAHGITYPFAVECAASEVRGIRRSAFLLHRGRRVLAVERDDTASFDAAALRRQVAWAHVDEILTLPAIPVDRRHNAKVDLAALRCRLS